MKWRSRGARLVSVRSENILQKTPLVVQLRVAIIFLILLFASGILLFRLFEKQVLEHNDYVRAAENQSTGTSSQPSERGRIFVTDHDGKLYPLAESEWRYNLQISPRQVSNKQKLVDTLSQELPSIDKNVLLASLAENKVYIPPIVKNLQPDVAEKIANKKLAGVILQPTLLRIYPEGQGMASQVVGFVGGDGSGKYGVEAIYDDVLAGKSGSEKAKRDSLGRLVDVLSQKLPEAGKDVILTIDYDLQYNVEKELKSALEQYQADNGSILVMDPKTGAVLAMAGTPSFDPNDTSKITGDMLGNLLSPAASNVYEPGSVIKPITMAAALDAGAVKPDTTNVFGQSVTVNGHEIFNAKKNAFGKENMIQVLENSDNVAMTWVSSLLGAEKERDYLDKFGIGRKTGLDLVGEQTGYLPPKQNWNDLLRSTAAFGQGISMTVTQLATAYSVIANGGTLVTPHLVAKTQQGDKQDVINFPARTEHIISPETAAKVRDMLVGVVEIGHGKRAKVDGIKVGGKTGTAQVPDPQGGYYEDRHIGSFAGMFPADDPKFVMVIRLDNPKAVNFAESSAAPTFGAIANWMTNYYQLK